MQNAPLTAEQAYKISILGERLKSKGLVLAEDALLLIVDETFDFVSESALVSKTPYDDIVVVVIPVAKQKLKADFVDKIDGQDDIQ